MTSSNRLIQMKKFLNEAELSPETNKLYIEDLKLSIAHFEKIVSLNTDYRVITDVILTAD